VPCSEVLVISFYNVRFSLFVSHFVLRILILNRKDFMLAISHTVPHMCFSIIVKFNIIIIIIIKKMPFLRCVIYERPLTDMTVAVWRKFAHVRCLKQGLTECCTSVWRRDKTYECICDYKPCTPRCDHFRCQSCDVYRTPTATATPIG